MMKKSFPGGSWPVMLTPFTEDNKVDYPALKALVDWYIKNGVSGLFAVCQSSEMFFLTLEERLDIAQKTVEYAAGRVPVIASGHISDSLEDQIAELSAMAGTGVDAVILITNRLAAEDEGDDVWIANCRKVLDALDPEMPLGFYECPYPYKRLLTQETIRWCAGTGRFYFLKDTCCDLEQIKEKLDIIRGTSLKLYNANTTTLLPSLRAGAAGFCGVMNNFHPRLYTWLCENYEQGQADALADFLSVASLIERQYYPVNAKYHLQAVEGLPITTVCRTKPADGMTETFKTEVWMLHRQANVKLLEISNCWKQVYERNRYGGEENPLFRFWEDEEPRGKADRLGESPCPYGGKRQGEYTLEDYLSWPDEQRVELIDGVIYDMASPTFVHQAVGGEIYQTLSEFIRRKGGKCIAFNAPVDVQVCRDKKTVVQPDVLVLCDKKKLRDGRIFGAPDFVVEVLSKSTRKKDMTIKLEKYREAGVREYWMVDLDRQKVVVYNLETDGDPALYGFDAKIPVRIFGGECQVDFEKIWRDLEPWMEETE